MLSFGILKPLNNTKDSSFKKYSWFTKMLKCPIFKVADILGKKWTIVLIQEIELNGGKGFNAIFQRLGKISPKILSKRLKELESKGIITREVIASEVPVRTKYRLTEKGKELQEVISSLKKWYLKYSDEKLECGRVECVKCPLY